HTQPLALYWVAVVHHVADERLVAAIERVERLVYFNHYSHDSLLVLLSSKGPKPPWLVQPFVLHTPRREVFVRDDEVTLATAHDLHDEHGLHFECEALHV